MAIKTHSATDDKKSPPTRWPPLKLEVKEGDGDDQWEVFPGGSSDALFSAQEKEDATDRAINCVAAGGGGFVVVHLHGLKFATPVFALHPRAELLRIGRETAERQSMPFMTPQLVGDFDVPDGDLELAVALWHICLEALVLWGETKFGHAYQYGTYVLVNRDSERYTLEQCESTAAAIHRLEEVVRHMPSSTLSRVRMETKLLNRYRP